MNTSLEDVDRALRIAVQRSSEVRELIRSVGNWFSRIASETEGERPVPPSADAIAPAVGSKPATPDTIVREEPLSPPPITLPTKRTTMRIGEQDVEIEVPYDPMMPKTFGNPRVIEAPPEVDAGTGPLAGGEPDLSLVVSRCRVKADACRWAIERRRLKSMNADHMSEIAPTDRATVERAKALPECWVWMVDPNFADRMPDDEALRLFASLYDNLAAAAELTSTVDGDDERRGKFIERAVGLLAEAQSALRIGAETMLFIEKERDQMEAYLWLKEYSQRFRIYIGRFMRLNDPAEPAQHNRLSADLASVKAEFTSYRSAAKVRKSLLNKVKYEAKRLGDLVPANGGGGEPGSPTPEAMEELLAHARTLDSAVQALLREGVPPSDVELRELILPVEDVIPEDFDPSDAFRRVLIEAERYRAAKEEKAIASEPAPARAVSAEVKHAASMLAGKRMFIVGGIRNEMSRRAIERDLGLAEVRWVTTVEHQSTAPFEAEVARADVVVVLVRFSGHAFVDDLGEMCARYDKAYVRIPAGYSTAQIAHHTVKQVSRKLAPTA